MARIEKPITINDRKYAGISEYIRTKHKDIEFKSTQWVNMFSKIYKRAKSEKCSTVNFSLEPAGPIATLDVEIRSAKPLRKQKATEAALPSLLFSKACNRCKEVKNSSEFYKDRCAKDGYAGICKLCKKTKKQGK